MCLFCRESVNGGGDGFDLNGYIQLSIVHFISVMAFKSQRVPIQSKTALFITTIAMNELLLFWQQDA